MAAAAAALAATRRLRAIGSQILVPPTLEAGVIRSPYYRRMTTTQCYLMAHTKFGGSSNNCTSRRPFPLLEKTARSNDIPHLTRRPKAILSAVVLGVRMGLEDVLKILYEGLRARVVDYFKMVVVTIAGLVVFKVLPKFGIDGLNKEMREVLKEATNLLNILHEKMSIFPDLEQLVYKAEQDKEEREMRFQRMEEALAKLQANENHTLKELDARIKALEDAGKTVYAEQGSSADSTPGHGGT